MFRLKSISILFLFVVLFSACNSKAREQKKADEQLQKIENLIELNDYEAAKLLIDSIHIRFPRLVDKRRMAVALKDSMIRRESSKFLNYADSILPSKIQLLDSLQKNFRFEKDNEYQEFGNYVYKTQVTEQNTNRNYLKCYVDENADIYLVSNVYGSKIEHHGIRIDMDDQHVQTDSTETGEGTFHQFTNEGLYWESLTFKNETGNEISSFIANNAKSRLKVTLIGKKQIVYYIPDLDKKAITESYKLWIVQKELKYLEQEKENAQIRIGRIGLKYQ
jgi:hypothetical protein